ncbi:glycoside hydrolase family 3 C-terminal domain-containing protein [Sphingomonas sp. ZT3P38]|uniref:beta-glucosidase n=1 Tax=Parasphingomonas zepuensis TaxID=3096161 RepID=UPI002FCA33EA
MKKGGRYLGNGIAVLALMIGISSGSTHAAPPQHAPTYKDRAAPIETRVADLMGRLTLDEKILLLAGESSMTLNAIPRLGIPSIRMTDGPTGVRSPEGKPATVFPVGVALAATWNPDLVREVGAAIGLETRAHGADVLLAPTVNIVRTPRWGRNFETYSEDPWLTGQIALGYVRGAQGTGIGVSIKHFAANNQESNRFVVDSVVDERTLREIYLPAFEIVVKQAEPWSVMASYNRLNGVYATDNRWLLTDLLKKEWGYKGFVVSDWGATHSTAPAANAGMDLEMPGPPANFGAKLKAAVDAGKVSLAQIDDNAGRIVRLIVRSGALDRAAPATKPGALRHAAVARKAAEEAIVLLKNAGILPLDPSIRSLAVIGPNADVSRIQGGGSSAVEPFDTMTTPLQALRAALPGVDVIYAKGVDNEETPPAALPAMFSPGADRAETGMAATYFATADASGTPVRSERATSFLKRISGNVAGPQVTGYSALRWEGFFWPRTSGPHEFSVRGTGNATITLDGRTILDKATASVPDVRDVLGFPIPRRTVTVDLVAGRGYPIRLDYRTGQTPYEYLSFGVREPRPSIDTAIAAARAADAAIVLVGSSSTTEGEGYDRTSLDLPGDQNRLVEAITAANPRTVVVLNAGAAMTMPWHDKVPAILDLWLPGEGGSAALADILFGRVSPSGKLPVSFPARTEDDAVDLKNPKSAYREGLLLGYRGFEARGVEPLFAFGHGLSYTQFVYSDLQAPRQTQAGKPVKVRLTVQNSGSRAGKEVVQLYVAPTVPLANEAKKQLRSFAKIDIPAGGKRRVELTLDPRAFSFYDIASKSWQVRAGAYQLMVGSSSDDLRLSSTINVSK